VVSPSGGAPDATPPPNVDGDGAPPSEVPADPEPSAEAPEQPSDPSSADAGEDGSPTEAGPVPSEDALGSEALPADDTPADTPADDGSVGGDAVADDAVGDDAVGDDAVGEDEFGDDEFGDDEFGGGRLDTEYDPLRDSPEAVRARHWIRGGVVMLAAGGALGIGATIMGLSDPCAPRGGNSCLSEARNRAALTMGVPALALVGGGAAALAVGLRRQRRIAASAALVRDGRHVTFAGLTVRGRF